jgi:LacI family transcriptional regulator
MVDLTSPFQPEVAQGVMHGLEGTQYQGIIVSASGDAQRQQRAIEALLDRQVDGLILIAPFTSTEWLEQLASNIPVVVIARHGASANYDTVVDEDFEGARLLVDHLVSLGHTKIAHTGHPSGGLKRPSVLSHTARRDGYEKAMKMHGLEARRDRHQLLRGGWLRGRDAGAQTGPPHRPRSSPALTSRRSVYSEPQKSVVCVCRRIFR